MNNPEYFDLTQKLADQSFRVKYRIDGGIGSGHFGNNLEDCARNILEVASDGGTNIQLRSTQDLQSVISGLVALSVADLELLATMLNQGSKRFSVGAVSIY